MQTNDAALTRHNGAAQVPAQTQSTGFLQNAPAFFEMATNLAKADIVPKEFRNKPANVFVALEMAHRLGIGPMEAMQNIYVVHGTPSMSAKFLIGLANRSGRFRGGLQFREEERKDTGLTVTCFALDRETGKELSVEASMAQAKRAGWSKNVKYNEIPGQMLSYRAATFFVRRYCPEVTLGMPTVDEARDDLPRAVDAEEKPNPIDVAPEPLEVEIHEPVPKEELAPAQFAPRKVVEKLVGAFTGLGESEASLVDQFGPSDSWDVDTVKRIREYGAALKRDLEEQAPEDETTETVVELFEGSREDDHPGDEA